MTIGRLWKTFAAAERAPNRRGRVLGRNAGDCSGPAPRRLEISFIATCLHRLLSNRRGADIPGLQSHLAKPARPARAARSHAERLRYPGAPPAIALQCHHAEPRREEIVSPIRTLGIGAHLPFRPSSRLEQVSATCSASDWRTGSSAVDYTPEPAPINSFSRRFNCRQCGARPAGGIGRRLPPHPMSAIGCRAALHRKGRPARCSIGRDALRGAPSEGAPRAARRGMLRNGMLAGGTFRGTALARV